MKIVISTANEVSQEISLDDEPFDIAGWIGIYEGEIEIGEVHLNELYPAVLAFMERYNKRIS